MSAENPVPGTIDELRAVVREAHAATKDLRRALREAEKLKASIGPEVESAVVAEVGDRISQVIPRVQEALDAAVDKAGAEFDKLRAILLGEDRRDGRSIKELVHRVAEADARIRQAGDEHS